MISCPAHKKKNNSMLNDNSLIKKHMISHGNSQFQAIKYFGANKQSQSRVLKIKEKNYPCKQQQNKNANYNENSSYCANTLLNLKQSKQIISCSNDDKIFLSQQLVKAKISHIKEGQSKGQVKDKNMVDLKKKIRKNISTVDNNFRSKVKFIRKLTNHPKSNRQFLLQQKCRAYEQFMVYQDRDIFSGISNKEWIQNIIPQRIDNDIETDQEQMQKFVLKVSSEFRENILKYMEEKKQISEQNSINKL